jgi:DNA polymerase phi
VIQSSTVFQTEDDINFWNEVLDLLCGLAKSVQWIREECGLVLCDSIKTLSTLSFAHLFVQSCLFKLQDSGLLKSPEGVAVWLTVQKSIPTFKGFPNDVWIENNPIDPRNRRELSKAMREQNVPDIDDPQGLESPGFWQQSIHFSWALVLQQGMSEDPEVRLGYDKFRDLWIGLVDGESIRNLGVDLFG